MQSGDLNEWWPLRTASKRSTSWCTFALQREAPWSLKSVKRKRVGLFVLKVWLNSQKSCFLCKCLKRLLKPRELIKWVFVHSVLPLVVDYNAQEVITWLVGSKGPAVVIILGVISYSTAAVIAAEDLQSQTCNTDLNLGLCCDFSRAQSQKSKF